MEPRFLAGTLDETAHMGDVELRPNWNFQDRHIVGILRALHADLEDGSPAGPLYGQSLSVALAHYLIRRFAVRTALDREYRNGMPTVRLNRVLDFMRMNCGQETRLWELANLAGMSPHYFCELFKKSTGVSPYQYSLRCRMDRAKEFLRSPQFTVRQVAEATGFADQSHFTKVFRRLVGLTPVQFRQQPDSQSARLPTSSHVSNYRFPHVEMLNVIQLSQTADESLLRRLKSGTHEGLHYI